MFISHFSIMNHKNVLPWIVPSSKTLSYEEYLSYTKDSLSHVFELNFGDSKTFPFNKFVENTDHGAVHAYNVYKRACTTADTYELQTEQKIDRSLLYIMSTMHDSGRFRYSIPSAEDTPTKTKAKENKRNKAEKEHARYGLAQIKLAKQKLEKAGISYPDEEFKKIENYILNHDFFNTRLDGDAYSEPQSIEGQIVRLSDRTSVPVTEEIDRYRETGKRLGTPYFVENIDLKDRLDFSFPKVKQYIMSWKFDEFTFFLALLSQSASDFSDPLLAGIYQEWAKSKQAGVEKILSIAKEEWYTQEQLKKMEILIKEYFEHFNITF